MKTPAEPPIYRVYVLRCWQEGYPSVTIPPVWRYSLEDPTTRQRRGFADLESLMNYLANQTTGSHVIDSGNHSQVRGEGNEAEVSSLPIGSQRM